MTPSGQRQAPVDFLSDVGLCVVAMRKTAFTILGALLIGGSAVQMATASERHMRTGRGHHQHPAVTILDVRRMHEGVEQQALGID